MDSLIKNILFVERGGRPSANYSIGGSIFSLLKIIESLDRRKFNPIVLFIYRSRIIEETFNNSGAKIIFRKREYHSGKLPKSHKVTIKSLIGKKLYTDLSVLKRYKDILYLMKIIASENIHIIHGNDRVSSHALEIITSKLTNVRCIIHQRSINPKLSFLQLYWGRKADHYFAVSNACYRNLINDYKINADHITVVHNWLDSNQISKEVHYRSPGDIFRIIWIGRIIPWKGLHLVVEIADLLRSSEFGKFQIDCFGDHMDTSPYFLKLTERIRQLGLEEFFVFKGFIPQSQISLSEYDVYLHSSVSPEPFGRTIIECMGACIPVVATNMGGVLDILEDKVSGFLYSPNDIDLVPEILQLVRTQHDKMAEIVNRAHNIVSTKFSSEKSMGTIERVYDIL